MSGVSDSTPGHSDSEIVERIDLDRVRLVAERYAAAYERMVELGGGVGQLGIEEPAMYQHMGDWQDEFECGRADTVLALLDEIERLSRALTDRDTENAALRDERQRVLDAVNIYADEIMHEALDRIGFFPRPSALAKDPAVVAAVETLREAGIDDAESYENALLAASIERSAASVDVPEQGASS